MKYQVNYIKMLSSAIKNVLSFEVAHRLFAVTKTTTTQHKHLAERFCFILFHSRIPILVLFIILDPSHQPLSYYPFFSSFNTTMKSIPPDLLS